MKEEKITIIGSVELEEKFNEALLKRGKITAGITEHLKQYIEVKDEHLSGKEKRRLKRKEKRKKSN